MKALHMTMQEAEHAFTLYEHHAEGIIKAVLDALCWETNCE